MTPAQQQRLQLLEDNFIVLQWQLRNKKLLPTDFSSPLQRDNDAVIKLLFSENSDLNIPAWSKKARVRLPSKRKSPRRLRPHRKKSMPFKRATGVWFVMAPRDGQVKITPLHVSHGSPFVSYVLKDWRNKVLASGYSSQASGHFEAKAQTLYFLSVQSGIVELASEGAAAASKPTVQRADKCIFSANRKRCIFMSPKALSNGV